MAIYNSDLMESFASGARVRTLNHRGSLLSDIATFPRNSLTAAATHLAVGDIVPVMPIAYKSMVRDIALGFVGTAPTSLVARLDLYGLKRDGKSIDKLIKQNILGAAIVLGADAAAELTTKAIACDVATSTIYNLLCEDKTLTNPDGTTRTIRTPIANFEPYKEDRFGILAWTVTAAATAGDVTSKGVLKVDFVEVAPSSGPYLDTMGVSSKQPSAI